MLLIFVFVVYSYLAKYSKQQEIPVDFYEEKISTEYNDLRSRISDIVITDAEKKIAILNTIDERITFILDSVEHYIMIYDVIWCLMKSNCFMANLKCELVLHCIKHLEEIFSEITYAQVNIVPLY